MDKLKFQQMKNLTVTFQQLMEDKDVDMKRMEKYMNSIEGLLNFFGIQSEQYELVFQKLQQSEQEKKKLKQIIKKFNHLFKRKMRVLKLSLVGIKNEVESMPVDCNKDLWVKLVGVISGLQMKTFNQMYEENVELKHSVEDLKDLWKNSSKKAVEMKLENKELQRNIKQINEKEEIIKELTLKLQKIAKENEELKQENARISKLNTQQLETIQNLQLKVQSNQSTIAVNSTQLLTIKSNHKEMESQFNKIRSQFSLVSKDLANANQTICEKEEIIDHQTKIFKKIRSLQNRQFGVFQTSKKKMKEELRKLKIDNEKKYKGFIGIFNHVVNKKNEKIKIRNSLVRKLSKSIDYYREKELKDGESLQKTIQTYRNLKDVFQNPNLNYQRIKINQPSFLEEM